MAGCGRQAIALALVLGAATSRLQHVLQARTPSSGRMQRRPSTRRRSAQHQRLPSGASRAGRDGPRLHQGRRGRALLGQADKNASQPWQNPATGARGMVTAYRGRLHVGTVSSAATSLRSYIRDLVKSWLQGDACLHPSGEVGDGALAAPAESGT